MSGSNNVYLAWSTFSGASGCSNVFVAVSVTNGTSFGAPVQVSTCTSGTENLQPIIAGDGTNVHVFWTDNVSGDNPFGADTGVGKIFYARSTNNGASFGVPNTAFVSAPGYSRPSSAVVRGTEVHLVFYDNRLVTNASVAGRAYHKMSCDSGATWGAESQVTQFDGDVDTEQPRLAVTTANEIFMIFRSSRGGIPFPGHTPFQVYLQRMASTNCPTQSANWLYPAKRLSNGSNVELGGNYSASIFAGQSGRLLTGWWNDTTGTNLMFRYGLPNGAGFAAQTDLSQYGLNHLQWGGDMAEFTGFGLGEDASNRFQAAFLQKTSLNNPYETGPLWYTCSPSVGAAFVGKRLVNGLASQPRAIMGNGRFHMVWMDFRFTVNNQAEIFYNFVNTTACTAPAPAERPGQRGRDQQGNLPLERRRRDLGPRQRKRPHLAGPLPRVVLPRQST